jgi:NAD(P)-dependent dehydrogenase (short-subunit alcohol dehydrogenase family)
LKTLTANISVTGALWHFKGKPDILKGNRGTLFIVQKAFPLLNDGASIILTGSVSGSKGTPAFSVYGATLLCARLDHGA